VLNLFTGKKKEPIYQDPSQIAILLHNFLCAKFVYIKSSTFNALNNAYSKDGKIVHSNLGNTPTLAIDDDRCFFFLTT
jgi:hypothetical protein